MLADIDVDIVLSIYELVVGGDRYATVIVKERNDLGYVKFNNILLSHITAAMSYDSLYALAFKQCTLIAEYIDKVIMYTSAGLFASTLWITGMSNQERVAFRVNKGQVGNKLRELSNSFLYTYEPIYSSRWDRVVPGEPRYILAACEFINGNNLDELIRSGGITLEQFKLYVVQVNEALILAWKKYKFQHNRLLAHNIMVSDRAVITNFEYCSFEEILIDELGDVYDDGFVPVDDMRRLIIDCANIKHSHGLTKFLAGAILLDDIELREMLSSLTYSNGKELVEQSTIGMVKSNLISSSQLSLQSLILCDILGLDNPFADKELIELPNATMGALSYVIDPAIAETFSVELLRSKRYMRVFAPYRNEIIRLSLSRSYITRGEARIVSDDRYSDEYFSDGGDGSIDTISIGTYSN
jgi:hypothetical protein